MNQRDSPLEDLKGNIHRIHIGSKTLRILFIRMDIISIVPHIVAKPMNIFFNEAQFLCSVN